MNFPTLYKKTHTGAIESWTITAFSTDGTGTDAGVIETDWGQVAGKRQTTQDVIKTGKNIGRANETSPLEQACQEAQSRWEKKLKKGYVKTIEAAEAGEVDAIITGGVDVMLAPNKIYPALGKKIVFPAYTQPKLDGHRCIATIDGDGRAHLWSRTRKPIKSMPHIVAALEKLALDTGDVGPWDGELYVKDTGISFQDLSSLIRHDEPQPGHEKLQYHIYDRAVPGYTFEDRRITEELGLEKPLVMVKTVPVNNAEELMAFFRACLADGYEGAMVRNTGAVYDFGKRSVNLQKLKEFEDTEFIIAGVVEGRGKMAGHGIFHCLIDAKKADTEENSFDVKMGGDEDRLIEFLEHPQKYIGREFTVKHQGWTDDHKPRCPVGLRFREDL